MKYNRFGKDAKTTIKISVEELKNPPSVENMKKLLKKKFKESVDNNIELMNKYLDPESPDFLYK
jgi:hypothetical protein